MNTRFDTHRGQVFSEPVALAHPHDIKVIDRPRPWGDEGQHDQHAGVAKQLVVIARAFATLFGPTPEMAELDAEQPRLDRVEAIVETLDLMLVLACLTVVAQHPALQR